jgi:hypothetical protein
MTNRAHSWHVPLLVASTISVVSIPAGAETVAGSQIDPADTPAPARIVIGPYKAYKPRISLHTKGVEATVNTLLAFRGEGISTFPVDRDDTGYETGFAFAPQWHVPRCQSLPKRKRLHGQAVELAICTTGA